MHVIDVIMVRSDEGIESVRYLLTPKGPDCVFWLHSNFGQVPMIRDFHILG